MVVFIVAIGAIGGCDDESSPVGPEHYLGDILVSFWRRDFPQQ